MHAIEIQHIGITLAVVGAENAIVLGGNVTLCVDGPNAATLEASGMNDLGGERRAHTDWVNGLLLSAGDVLTFRFFHADDVTPPMRERATDSEECIADQ